jgi:hypothetical protein
MSSNLDPFEHNHSPVVRSTGAMFDFRLDSVRRLG